jgi:hypothetical protein
LKSKALLRCCLECPSNVNALYRYLKSHPAHCHHAVLRSILDGPAHAYFAHNAFGFRREEVRPLPVRIPVSNFTELMTEVSYKRQRLERRCVGDALLEGSIAIVRGMLTIVFLSLSVLPKPEGGGTGTNVRSWR